MKNNHPAPRRRGRPPAFDREAVLAKAAETFWRLGYEGASIVDLTAAMGITPQSLYAAFKSKADLYREALQWYQDNVGASIFQEAVKASNVVDALARLLHLSAREFTRPDHPLGCMVWTSVLNCAVENEPIAAHVACIRTEGLEGVKALVEFGIAEGQMRPETDADALSRFVVAMIQGMSVQAQDGAPQQALLAMAQHAVSEIERFR